MSLEIVPTYIISELYFTILGSLSLGTEAMLAAPQFIKNYRNGSTTGMSIFMVLGWLCGDLFKVIYFYLLRNGSKSITVHCYPVKTCYTLVQFKMTSQIRTRSATGCLGLGRGIVERCFVPYSWLSPVFQKIKYFPEMTGHVIVK